MFKMYPINSFVVNIILKRVYTIAFSLKKVCSKCKTFGLMFLNLLKKYYNSGIIGRVLFDSLCFFFEERPIPIRGHRGDSLIPYFEIMEWCMLREAEFLERLRALLIPKNLHSHESLIINEYFIILLFLLLAIIISYAILSFSYIFVVQNPETEKMSAYECGFEPYEDARQKFDVKFYIVAMLFIIFDIETMFLIPWCVALPYINSAGYFVMMEFILELCVGFLYVWYVGGLDWN